MSLPAGRLGGPSAGDGAPPDAHRLADELADLLADALVADGQQFPEGGRESHPPCEAEATQASGLTRAAAASAIMPGMDDNVPEHPRPAD